MLEMNLGQHGFTYRNIKIKKKQPIHDIFIKTK